MFLSHFDTSVEEMFNGGRRNKLCTFVNRYSFGAHIMLIAIMKANGTVNCITNPISQSIRMTPTCPHVYLPI